MKLKRALLGILALLSISLMLANPSWAIPLTTDGTPIIAIDGNGDTNVTVDILSGAATLAYQYGYFLNGSSAFHALGILSLSTFQGGDLIDFALYDGKRFYTLSGDAADNSYQVTMSFTNEVTTGAPQQPADWSDPYYYNVNMKWSLATVVYTGELAINFLWAGNDGIAPVSSVPEPTSLILLGAGFLGLGIYGRKKFGLK